MIVHSERQPQTLGQVLRFIRHLHGYSMGDMARMIEMPVTVVSAVERDQEVFLKYADAADRMAAVLNTKVETIKGAIRDGCQ